VYYRNGSIVRFKTTRQGTLNLASATIDYVGIDEPPPPDVFSELQARVLRRGGRVVLSLTPIGRPVDYLRKLVDAGEVAEVVAGLTLRNVTPLGGRALLRQEQIDRVGRMYVPAERDQRMFGAWDGVADGRWVTGWADEVLSADLPVGEVWIGVGIDHGTTPGSQAAVLVYVQDFKGYSRVHVVDEYRGSGRTSSADDARSVLRMLARNGVRVEEVDVWVGDRPVGRNADAEKSNALLEDALADALGLDADGYDFPCKIVTPSKFEGSVLYGTRLMSGLMIEGRFHVHPRAEWFANGCKYWEGGNDDPLKHVLDAGRYAVEKLHDEGRIQVPPSVPLYR